MEKSNTLTVKDRERRKMVETHVEIYYSGKRSWNLICQTRINKILLLMCSTELIIFDLYLLVYIIVTIFVHIGHYGNILVLFTRKITNIFTSEKKPLIKHKYSVWFEVSGKDWSKSILFVLFPVGGRIF